MSRLTWGGPAKPISRDQILRHEQCGQGNIHFSCFQLTTCRTGNLTRLIHTLAIYVIIHTFIHIPIKCQSRSSSRRGTKVNGSHHGDNPLFKPTGIQIATKFLEGPINREQTSETYRHQEDVFALVTISPVSKRSELKCIQQYSVRYSIIPYNIQETFLTMEVDVTDFLLFSIFKVGKLKSAPPAVSFEQFICWL